MAKCKLGYIYSDINSAVTTHNRMLRKLHINVGFLARSTYLYIVLNLHNRHSQVSN